MAEAELVATDWQENGQVGFLQLLPLLRTSPKIVPGGEAPFVQLARGPGTFL